MTDIESPEPTRNRSRLAAVFAIGALTVVVLALVGIVLSNHVNHEYSKRDDRYVALALKSDKNMKSTKIVHAKAMSAAAIKFEKATKKAVKAQKNRDVRTLRRVVRRYKSRIRREIKAAHDAGYSSGSATGYSSGHSEGEKDGLVKGSDSLTCSDDPDVYWLPACFDF